MRIFFFSTVFAPKVGGIQRMAEVLCSEFVAAGHEVRLATLTLGGEDSHRPFEVVRQPSLAEFFRMLRWCDIHIQANVSLKYAFPLLLRRNRLVYRHANAYQRDDGTLAPLDRLKRLIARHSMGVANSRYTADKLGCAYTVLNAYDDETFTVTVPWASRGRDLVFVGRLVSQKGCDVLLRALGMLRMRGIAPSLTVVGDGPDRDMLEALADEEGLRDQVRFTGTLQGKALVAELNRHRVIVVPSRYEEPFGIVALEGLACGCVPIVSERGGLPEAIGGHGFTFSNGDDVALAAQVEAVLRNPKAARRRLQNVEAHLSACSARAVAAKYLAVFENLVEVA